MIAQISLHILNSVRFMLCSISFRYERNQSPELVEVDETPPSRPLTPNEQIDIMMAIEREDDVVTGLPSDRDLQVWSSFAIKTTRN